MTKFNSTLTYWQLVLLGFGNTIASGIFILQGIAAKYAGAGVFISFIIAGMVSLLTAMIYAEFASRMPFSGSGYIYIYSSFGELPAWVVGWSMNLRFGVTAGAQSKVWASYMVGLLKLLGVMVPAWMYHVELFGGTHVMSLVSIAFILACTLVSTRGSEESSLFNQVFTLAKLVVLLFLLVVSICFFNFDNYKPLLSQHHPEYGALGMVIGATLVFYAYLGFDIIPAVAEEAKNPKKDVPRAIIH